jgi:hypothetical protein
LFRGGHEEAFGDGHRESAGLHDISDGGVDGSTQDDDATLIDLQISQGALSPTFASGAVYIFVRSGGTWVQQAYLKASNTRHESSLGANFGSSLSLSGDTFAQSALLRSLRTPPEWAAISLITTTVGAAPSTSMKSHDGSQGAVHMSASNGEPMKLKFRL